MKLEGGIFSPASKVIAGLRTTNHDTMNTWYLYSRLTIPLASGIKHLGENSMAGKFVITYKDYGVPGETSTVTFNTPDANAANIADLTTDADTLRLALEAITLGGVQKRQLIAWVNDTKVEPTDKFAQRETKWLVRYKDNSSLKMWSLEIPCADLNFLDPNNSGKMLMTSAEALAFKAAFEAFHRSPEGNAVTLVEIVHLGKNT